jgi:hypothetical protein
MIASFDEFPYHILDMRHSFVFVSEAIKTYGKHHNYDRATSTENLRAILKQLASGTEFESSVFTRPFGIKTVVFDANKPLLIKFRSKNGSSGGSCGTEGECHHRRAVVYFAKYYYIDWSILSSFAAFFAKPIAAITDISDDATVILVSTTVFRGNFYLIDFFLVPSQPVTPNLLRSKF